MLAWYFTGAVALAILGLYVWSAFRLMPRLTAPETLEFESLERAQARYEANQKVRFGIWYVLPLIFGLLMVSQLSSYQPSDNPYRQTSQQLVTMVMGYVLGTSLMAIIMNLKTRQLADKNPVFAQCRPSTKTLIWSLLPLISVGLAIPLSRSVGPSWELFFALCPVVAIVLMAAFQQRMIFSKQYQLPADSPLAQMLTEVAERMGQPVPTISIYPHIHANAFAFPNGKVMMTGAMRTICSDREIVAVLAHEFSHIRDKEGKKYQNWSLLVTLIPMTAILVPLVVAPGITMPLQQSIGLALTPFLFYPLAMLRARFTRRMEFKCDADAAKLGFGPDMANALEKLCRYSGLPLRWKGHDRWIATHPDTEERLRRLRATPPVP